LNDPLKIDLFSKSITEGKIINKTVKQTNRQLKMNSNTNNNRLCRNGQTDDLNACRGQVAEGNNYGLCEVCERQRRQVALDEIFARHNMSAIGGGSASGRMNLRAVIEQCERCRRDIYDDEQAYTQRIHTVREEDGEPMV
jgi:hypothetical protein